MLSFAILIFSAQTCRWVLGLPHDVWRYVPQVSCPTLVLYGKDSDTFLPAARRRFKKLNPQAKLVGLDKTSHFVPQERPKETKAAMVEFLEEHGLLQ